MQCLYASVFVSANENYVDLCSFELLVGELYKRQSHIHSKTLLSQYEEHWKQGFGPDSFGQRQKVQKTARLQEINK